MFHKKGTIDELLICKSCDSVYDDPRTLPCGHTFCNYCINSKLLSPKTNQVECVVCMKKHEYNESGFMICLMALALLSTQAQEVNQSDEVRELRRRTKEIEEKKKQIEFDMRSGCNEIKEYCQSFKTQIELEKERQLEQICKEKEELKTSLDACVHLQLEKVISISNREEFNLARRSTNRNIVCNFCMTLLVDWLKLPCGHRYCLDCVKLFMKQHEDSIECSMCRERHFYDTAGFLVSPRKVEKKINKIRQLRRISIGEIEEMASIKSEEVLKKVEGLIRQVDIYQNECIESYGTFLQTNKQKFDSLWAEIDSFHTKVESTLSQYEVGDQQVKDLMAQATSFFHLMEDKQRLIKRKKFNNQMLQMPPAFTDSLRYKLTGLDHESISISVVDLMNKKSGNCLGVVYSTSKDCFYTVSKMREFLVVAGYANSGEALGNNLGIGVFNNFAEFIGSFFTLLETKNGLTVVMKTDDRKKRDFLYLNVQGESYELSPQAKTVLVNISRTNKYLTSLSVASDLSEVVANSTSIFCLENQTVLEYTHDLESTFNDFHENIPAQTHVMHANETSLFFLHTETGDMKLRVIDIASKSVQHEIEMPSLSFHQMKLVSNRHLAVFDNERNRVRLYDQSNIAASIPLEIDLEDSILRNLLMTMDSSRFISLHNEIGETYYFSIEEIN